MSAFAESQHGDGCRTPDLCQHRRDLQAKAAYKEQFERRLFALESPFWDAIENILEYLKKN